jgi:hypothetical protein
MLRTKIKKKGERTKKTKTKFNGDVTFPKNNSIESTNATLSSNGCPDASPLHSNNNIKLTVVGSNALRNNVDSIASTSSSTPRGMALLNQTTLYDVPSHPCHQINMTNVIMTDTDKQNNITPTVPLSHGIGSRAFGNFSPEGGTFISQQQQLYFQSEEQLRKLFQQQQLLVIEYLQRQVKQGMLNAKESNEAISRCHPPLLGWCNIATNDANDVELDLDTIFEDNDNDFNNYPKNA